MYDNGLIRKDGTCSPKLKIFRRTMKNNIKKYLWRRYDEAPSCFFYDLKRDGLRMTFDKQIVFWD